MNSVQTAHVITVSDSCTSGEREDISGPTLRAGLEQAGWQVRGPEIVPDDATEIASALQTAVDAGIALIVTTGGTGFSPRDVTPEATKMVLEREAPGLAELLRWKGYQKFERAVLSRGVCGIAGSTLIINLPGSVGGVRDGLETLLPLLSHACGIIQDEPTDHSEGGSPVSTDTTPRTVDVIETNLDDVSPEVYELLLERLFAAGALDVSLTPIIMKKQRPAIKVTVITVPKNRGKLAEVLFTETGSFGVRFARHERITVTRSWQTVETPFGAIKVKVGTYRGRVIAASPEYSDVKAAALANGAPVREVYAAAVVAFKSVD